MVINNQSTINNQQSANNNSSSNSSSSSSSSSSSRVLRFSGFRDLMNLGIIGFRDLVFYRHFRDLEFRV